MFFNDKLPSYRKHHHPGYSDEIQSQNVLMSSVQPSQMPVAVTNDRRYSALLSICILSFVEADAVPHAQHNHQMETFLNSATLCIFTCLTQTSILLAITMAKFQKPNHHLQTLLSYQYTYCTIWHFQFVAKMQHYYHGLLPVTTHQRSSISCEK
jgi:hypothetical protein